MTISKSFQLSPVGSTTCRWAFVLVEAAGPLSSDGHGQRACTQSHGHHI